MTPIFVDTSGIIAVVNEDDHWHRRGTEVWAQFVRDSVPLVTTSAVLIELADGLSRVDQRSLATQVSESFRHSALLEVIQVSGDLEEAAWELYAERPDKEWGMTDCISFIVMRDGEMTQAFTADHHFEQAGFVRLLN